MLLRRAERITVSHLMTVAELAARVGWKPQAIYQRRLRGDSLPPAIKLGNGRIRFREDDVQAWLDAQVEQSPEPKPSQPARRSVGA